jgi:L,D-peptidoglycan transpeptidase YkuD (ErfK/YbiS/YcfS/YnhG family)
VSARVRRRRALAVLLLVLVAVGVWTAMSGRPQASAGAAASAGSSPSVTVPSSTRTPPSAAGAASSEATGTATSDPTGTASPDPTGTASPGAAGTGTSGARPGAAAGTLGQVAGLGPSTAATVPAESTQAVVVRGDGETATTTGIELYERDARGWRRTGAWRGHVGARGWTDDHREGDLSTPVGTYGLSDAGGRLADPGTELPYHESQDYVPSGDGVFGDSLVGSFDYVLAIDYNRVPGRSPLDRQRPDGEERGGGIWLHVDHDGPTHGCVSVPEDGMRTLLRALLPAAHPVVVMGDRDRLSA